jgi:hypothetical protein
MSRPIPMVRRKVLSTDEGYQPNLEAFVGNFTAKIAALKVAIIEPTLGSVSPWLSVMDGQKSFLIVETMRFYNVNYIQASSRYS